MKTYHGIRLSNVLGDVKVSVRQQWGTCGECQDIIPAGPDHKFEHFDKSFRMCTAPITQKEILASPLMKRSDTEPNDFEWGPGHRAGAYNLSLAILWDIYGEQPSHHIIKSFALRTIMALPRDEWYISEHEVRLWMHTTSPRYAVA